MPTTPAIGHTIYRYNDAGDLGRLSHGRGTFTDTDAEVIAKYLFGYEERGQINSVDTLFRDAAGNLLSKTGFDSKFNQRGEVTSISGDLSSDLVDLTPGETGTFGRDGEGNSIEGTVYDEQNRLASFAGDAYTYDQEGRLKQVGDLGVGFSYDWDHRGLLREVVLGSSGSGTVEFFYDVLGRKVARRELDSGQAETSHTVYAWDGRDLAFEIDRRIKGGELKGTFYFIPFPYRARMLGWLEQHEHRWEEWLTMS